MLGDLRTSYLHSGCPAQLMPLVGKLGGGDPQKRAELFNAHIIKHGVATGEE